MLNFPNSPVQGDTYAAEGASYTYDNGRWVLLSHNEALTTVADGDTGAGWYVVGDLLVQWGTAIHDGTDVPSTHMFPRSFQSIPTITAVPITASGQRRVTVINATTASFGMVTRHTTTEDATANGAYWIATGEAQDVDKKPTQLVGTDADLFLRKTGGLLTGDIGRGQYSPPVTNSGWVLSDSSLSISDNGSSRVLLNQSAVRAMFVSPVDTNVQGLLIQSTVTGVVHQADLLRIGDGDRSTLRVGKLTPANNIYALILGQPTSDSLDAGRLLFSRAGANGLLVNQSSGSLFVWGVNTATGATVPWANISDNTGWAAGSDERRKSDMQPLEYGIDTIKQLSPLRYTWKDSGKVAIGFGAQSMQQVVPEIVVHIGEDDEEFWGISDGGLEPVLVSAMQQLITRVEALEARTGETQ